MGTEAAGLFASTDHAHTWVQIGANLGGAAVNALLLGRDVLNNHVILILHGGVLRVYVNHDAYWYALDISELAECQATAVAAPVGLAHNTLLLIGSVEGHVERTIIKFAQPSSVISGPNRCGNPPSGAPSTAARPGASGCITTLGVRRSVARTPSGSRRFGAAQRVAAARL